MKDFEMTHGESWYYQKKQLERDGLDHKQIIDLPDRMSRKDAVKYYNSKVFDYWLNCLDSRISEKRKKKALSLLMFRDIEFKKYVNV